MLTVTVLSRVQSGLRTEKVLILLQTFVPWWIFLDSSLWTRDDRNNFPNSWVFPFFVLFNKTGHLHVLPAYSYTHRYNKISLNIKEKTRRYWE